MGWRERMAERLLRKDKAEPAKTVEIKKPARPEPFDHEYYRDDRVGAPGTITVTVGRGGRVKIPDVW